VNIWDLRTRLHEERQDVFSLGVFMPFNPDTAPARKGLIAALTIAAMVSTSSLMAVPALAAEPPVPASAVNTSVDSAVAIDGTVAVDSLLTANTSAWAEGSAISYRWIVGQSTRSTEQSYSPTSADVAQSLILEVTVTEPGAQPAVFSTAPVVVAKGIFPNIPVPTIDGKMKVGELLSAGAGDWGFPAKFAYRWLVDGVSAGTGSTFRPAGAHLGKRLSLEATASRAGFVSASSTTPAAVVGKGAPLSAPALGIHGSLRVGTLLTASVGKWPAGTTFAYAWKVSGKMVSSSRTFTPVWQQRGKSLSLVVRASTPGYDSVVRTTEPKPIGFGYFTSAPTPKVSGTYRVGSTLSASAGPWAPTATVKYQWLRNGAPIRGATAKTYQLKSLDWKKKVTVKVTATRFGYASSTRTNTVSSGVAKVFAKSASPTISGTTRVGSVLTAQAPGWSPAPSFSYQWKRSGTSISGATGKTYRLTKSDYGKTISVAIVGKASGYVATTKTSRSTGKVTGPAPAITKSGTYKVGSTIAPGTYMAYAKPGCYWERRSSAGSNLDGIISNDFIALTGRTIVTIASSDRYFYTNADCGKWTKYVGLGSPASSVGNGTHVVGVHVKPGVYKSNSASNGCYWEIVSGFGGSTDEILENDFTYDAPNYVKIYKNDKGFTSSDCGTWSRVSD
jgi:hypothetical protein